MNDQRIELEGAFTFSSEGWWFSDRRCRQDIRSTLRKIPPIIWIETGADERRRHGVFEDGSLARLRPLMKEHRGDLRWRLMVTIYGIVQTTAELRKIEPVSGGYGHLSDAPAQIVVITIRSARWVQD